MNPADLAVSAYQILTLRNFAHARAHVRITAQPNNLTCTATARAAQGLMKGAHHHQRRAGWCIDKAGQDATEPDKVLAEGALMNRATPPPG